LLDDELEPPGPLLEAADPLVPPLVDEPLPMPPPEVLDEPPVPALELESEGELGAVEDEDEEPPGTTTVSFSFVVVLLVEDPLGEVVVDPPGTTVVVSLRSHADSANAPISTNR
jgi:hypothetical protein